MASTLRQLLDILNKSVEDLEQRCAATGTSIPDLNAPFYPQSEAFRADPEAAEAAICASAAALHIEAILSPSHVSLYHAVSGPLKATSLRICLESNVTEILREAGPEGLHVDLISEKNGQDPLKLARFLRYLATQHIYREIRPNVFTNNRISSIMDTMKPSQDVIANPSSKHDNTMGLAALASHHLDEVFKGCAYGWETLADPKTVKSYNPAEAPVARAFGLEGTVWELYETDKFRQSRFNTGMRGVQALQPDAISAAYEWDTLPAGSVVVDVGGGVGSSCQALAKKLPSLEYVVQDLESVISEAKELWKSTLPDANVTLEVQDFFTPQPKDRNVSIFLLKQILHDWSDEYCVKILTQLRAASSPETRLISLENIVLLACHDPETGSIVPGYAPPEAPAPLLANYGVANGMSYIGDITMFVAFNAQERTIAHLEALLKSTGWKLVRVRGNANFLQSIEAIPI